MAASCTDTTLPVFANQGGFAVTQVDGGHPVLFVQSFDGGQRRQLHLTAIADSIPGNGSVVASEANVVALGEPAVFGYGERVAVVATLGSGQSEIVVLNGDGTGGQVASPNTRIIGSAPRWGGANGSKIAYTMSTASGGFDLFITDLLSHTVTQLTTGANLSNAVIAWSDHSPHLYYARITGTTTDGLGNALSEVVAVDHETQATFVVASGIVGQVVSISGSGDKVLVTRTASVGGTTTRQLIEHSVFGSDRLLVGSNVVSSHYVPMNPYLAVIETTASSDAASPHTLMLWNLSTLASLPLSGLGSQARVDAWLIPLLPR